MSSAQRAPDLVGRVARAWRVKNESTVPDHAATLGQWLVKGPFHPFWNWWGIAVIHLRPIAGVRPARKRYPEAEYEFLILSIDPEHVPDPDRPQDGYHFLTPPDLVAQFHGVSDRDAVRILDSCIRAICDGVMSPDSDYRGTWHQVLAETVKHFREGRPPEPS